LYDAVYGNQKALLAEPPEEELVLLPLEELELLEDEPLLLDEELLDEEEVLLDAPEDEELLLEELVELPDEEVPEEAPEDELLELLELELELELELLEVDEPLDELEPLPSSCELPCPQPVRTAASKNVPKSGALTALWRVPMLV
jgi:hypothetical protein